MHETFADWIQKEAVSLGDGAPASFSAAVDEIITSLSPSVQLLGFGEALHGGEEIMVLRNRFFQHLVQAHGYCAIAIESSFPKGRVVNDYISGNSPATYEDVNEQGFSPGFAGLEANRELVEWMRAYNADPAHPEKLRFYGFDIPVGMMGYPSPRQVLDFTLDYLTSVDAEAGQKHRACIDPLIGLDADWENPAMYADPNKAMGITPAAAALRLATEDLITGLRVLRPGCVQATGEDAFLEALQHAVSARELLNSHAGMGSDRADRTNALLGVRDALMADNLCHIAAREQHRGKVLVFAHNSHLQLGKAALPKMGYAWWPAGAQLHGLLGLRYAAIGTALGTSEENAIGEPEAGTLEARLLSLPGEAVFVPTHRGQGLPPATEATLPSRSGSERNLSYVPLIPQSLTDFDGLLLLKFATYARGGRPLPG